MGAMVTAANLANFVIQPCQMLIQNYAKLKATKGIREKVEQMINEHKEIEDQNIQIDSVDEVSLSHVSFSYPESQNEVLSDITIKIHKNEKIAVVGASGCGKSTIARLLCQYYQRNSGTMNINDVDIDHIDTQSLYSKIGYISQRTFLFRDTIRNNICLYQSFSDDEIEKAVSMSGLSEYVHSLPDGLDTMINENGKNVSGGQMQRIGIARLLIREYNLMIADEITANLDVKTTEDIMNKLFDLKCMMIVITHDVNGEFMNRFDKIYQIDRGVAYERVKYRVYGGEKRNETDQTPNF
ncbi:ABC transporter, ATP-binding/permease protein [Lachnospiraceae bacterium KM106-2]|nr:ABC transporter, ATP-binding/permease protein [Lachnospiraceae bacterium KM106-2]